MKHLAVLFVIALGSGCMVGDLGDRPEPIEALPEIDCSQIREWAQNTVYPAGNFVTDTGDAFSSRVTHTAFAPDWNPKRSAPLWMPQGRCAGAGGGGEQPPPPPPEEDEGDGDESPPPPPAEGCQANGRPGPLFDVAGEDNVGNGNGEQFIGGQCLDASDCASGCCA